MPWLRAQLASMISALSNRAALAFQVFEGRFVTQTFLDFLQRLIKHGKGKKIALIVDAHPLYSAILARQWIAEQRGAVTLHFPPGYAPELNPDELLNHDQAGACQAQTQKSSAGYS